MFIIISNPDDVKMDLSKFFFKYNYNNNQFIFINKNINKNIIKKQIDKIVIKGNLKKLLNYLIVNLLRLNYYFKS